ncbi:MAG: hypothetical protein ACREIC_11330, partial [Limisphaerales bacterium]
AIQAPPAPALSAGAPALSLNPGLATAVNPQTRLTNFSVEALAAQLARLEGDLDQLLPMLSTFNNSFDFITTGSSLPATATSGGAVNLGSNLGVNLGSNLGSNLATRMAATTGPNFAGVAVTNVFGFPPGLGVAPITAQTLRALLVLQNDIERMLPTVNSLNGGASNFVAIGLAPGFAAGSVTNVFGVSTTAQ